MQPLSPRSGIAATRARAFQGSQKLGAIYQRRVQLEEARNAHSSLGGYSDVSEAHIWKRRVDESDARSRRTGSPTREPPSAATARSASRPGNRSAPCFSRPNSAMTRSNADPMGSFRSASRAGMTPCAPASPPTHSRSFRSASRAAETNDNNTTGSAGSPLFQSGSPFPPELEGDDTFAATQFLPAASSASEDVAGLYVGLVDAGAGCWVSLVGAGYSNDPESLMMPPHLRNDSVSDAQGTAHGSARCSPLEAFFTDVEEFLRLATTFDELCNPYLILEASWVPILTYPDHFLRALTQTLSISIDDAQRVFTVVSRIVEGFHSRILAWDVDVTMEEMSSVVKYRDGVVEAVQMGGAAGVCFGDTFCATPEWTPKVAAVWDCALCHFLPPFEM